MKSIIICLFSCISLLSMSFKDNNDNINLYEQSLLLHLNKIKDDTIFIVKCFDIELPNKIGKFFVIDIEGNAKQILKNKHSFIAVKVLPLQINRGDVEVGFIDYLITENNNNNNTEMNNTGSEIFRYRYDPKSKKYKLIKRLGLTI